MPTIVIPIVCIFYTKVIRRFKIKASAVDGKGATWWNNKLPRTLILGWILGRVSWVSMIALPSPKSHEDPLHGRVVILHGFGIGDIFFRQIDIKMNLIILAQLKY